jgi:hypothetical protein
LIGAAQRVEHFEIAGYGTVRALSETLGEDEDVSLLTETLAEEKETDEKLTELATESIAGPAPVKERTPKPRMASLPNPNRQNSRNLNGSRSRAAYESGASPPLFLSQEDCRWSQKWVRTTAQ